MKLKKQRDMTLEKKISKFYSKRNISFNMRVVFKIWKVKTLEWVKWRKKAIKEIEKLRS